jgi:hypothetical protein
MLKRLTMDNLELSREHISFIDVYCSERAKLNLERPSMDCKSLWDKISQVVIGTSSSGEPQATPILLPSYTLIERTELYGVNNTHLPDKVISDVFGAIFMDTDVQIPSPRTGETQAPKSSFLKFASHPGQGGLDIQFEFPPEVALQITRGVRDYLPTELIKDVYSYIQLTS